MTHDWHPGQEVVFASTRNGSDNEAHSFDLYRMQADGSGITRLTNNTDIDQIPRWSPDGGTIAFATARDANGEIYVMNPDGSGLTNLTQTSSANEAWFAWSPGR